MPNQAAWHPVGMGKRLIRPLQLAAITAFVLAVAGAAIPGRGGEILAALMVGLLVATPVLRVAFFVVRWAQIGDRRFAAVAFLLLLELAAGAALALS